MAAPAPSEAILRAYYDELTDKMRNTREANTEVDLASLQDLVWEHGLDAISQSIQRDVFRTGTGEKRVTMMSHALLLSIVEKSGKSRLFSTYGMFSSLLESHLTATVKRVREAYHGTLLLEEVSRCWQAHLLVTEWMSRLFRPVDPPHSALSFRQMCGTELKAAESSFPLDPKPYMFPSLRCTSVRLFKTCFFDLVKTDVIDVIHGQVVRDRQSGDVNRQLLKQAIHMFMVMGACMSPEMTTLKLRSELESKLLDRSQSSNRLYVEDFENHFVSRTLAYYAPQVASWFTGLTVGGYLRAVCSALQSEDDRARALVCDSSRRRVIQECRQMMLAAGGCELVSNTVSGMLPMLRSSYRAHVASSTGVSLSDAVEFGTIADPKEELGLLFSLMIGPEEMGITSILPAIVAMGSALQEFIREAGMEIVRQRKERHAPREGATGPPKPPPANDPVYVKALIALLTHVRTLHRLAFRDHVELGKGLLRGMEQVLNCDSDNPEIIATFMDQALQGKDGKDKLDTAGISANIVDALGLVRYLVDQDVFLDCYLNLLSKRLLLNKFSSLEHEEEAVTKMRDLFGLHFTHRIANLITNYKLVTDKWRDDVVDVPPTEDKVEFRMLPLQLSCWPQLQLFEGVSLPHEMAFLRRRFQTKYEAENPSHVLRWVFGQGSATVNIAFDATTITMTGTTLQAVVLLTLGRHHSMKVKDLAAATGIPMSALRTLLGSLCFVKDTAVLRKEPKGPKIEDDSIVSIEYGFKSPKRAFNLPAVSLEEKVRKEGESIDPSVLQDRNFMIDATIVRIMKARREPMDHRELVAETTRQILIFRPTERMIKHRIAELISLDYMKRVNPDVPTSPYM